MMSVLPAPTDNAPLRDATGSERTEAEIVRATLAGNSHAFSDIIRLHHRRVYNFLHQMTRQHQDAEDLTQQTFIKAFHSLARFQPHRPLINWMLTIARNTALNHFRDTKKWDEIPADAATSEPSPVRAAETRERSENLWARARALLSPREFEILWLRFAEELSTAETATVVGLTETHVKVIVHRARQTLLKGVNRL
jgi:RNA polymerase sigma-70 factor (ECF subfamily)